jgi:hypothetical protein
LFDERGGEFWSNDELVGKEVAVFCEIAEIASSDALFKGCGEIGVRRRDREVAKKAILLCKEPVLECDEGGEWATFWVVISVERMGGGDGIWLW